MSSHREPKCTGLPKYLAVLTGKTDHGGVPRNLSAAMQFKDCLLIGLSNLEKARWGKRKKYARELF
jgi:hypothetical protein